MKSLTKNKLFAGRFEIQGEISKGQTGTILYGYDLEARQEVAIKIYHSRIDGELIRAKAFIEKSKPLLLIDHPNLIKIFRVEKDEDTPIIFMEFFDAPSLRELIYDKGPLPVQDMLRVAREITEVLVHTHFQGIIHGTLHPGHVLVSLQGQIKVMDLGLSWILMDILPNCNEELLRPLPYFPPEIAKGELLNVSSDLYALGFMMYEMLTGTVPYAGLAKTSIMGKLSFDQSDPVFNFPDSVPEVICNLIRHMTHNKSQERLQDSTHVLTIINQQLSKLPLCKESILLAPQLHPPQVPEPKEEKQPAKASTPSAPPPIPEPARNPAPPVQRPQASIDYGQVKNTHTLRNVSIALGIVILVGLAGGLGYWYRDTIEPFISGNLTQPENSSREIIREQPLPTKQNRSKTPPQDILDTSKPQVEAPGTVERPKTSAQPVGKQKKSIVKPGAQPTGRTTITVPKPNKSNIQQPTRTSEAQTNKASVRTKKPSFAPTSSTPVQQRPKRTTPVAPKIAPPSKTQATKITTVPKSPVKPPSASSSSQVQPVLPAKKQTKPSVSSAPVRQQPPKGAPTIPEKAPLLSPTATKNGTLQRSPSQPKTENAIPAPSVIPTKKPALSSPSPVPVQQQPTKTTPVIPKSAPQTTTNTTKNKSIKNRVSVVPANEMVDQEKKSAVAIPTSKNTLPEATDAEIEEILQSLDAAKEDLSSIATP